MNESKSEIRNLLISAGVVNEQADFIENNLHLKFYIIPKSDPPEKRVGKVWKDLGYNEDGDYIGQYHELKWREYL